MAWWTESRWVYDLTHPLRFKFYVKNKLHSRRCHYGAQNSTFGVQSMCSDENIILHLIKCQHAWILNTCPAPVGHQPLHSLYQMTSSDRERKGTPARDLSCGMPPGKRLIVGGTGSHPGPEVQGRGWEQWGGTEGQRGQTTVTCFFFKRIVFQSLKCYFYIFLIFENLQNWFPFHHFNVATRNFQIEFVVCIIFLLDDTGLELSAWHLTKGACKCDLKWNKTECTTTTCLRADWFVSLDRTATSSWLLFAVLFFPQSFVEIQLTYTTVCQLKVYNIMVWCTYIVNFVLLFKNS